MIIVRSKNDIPIRLTKERWAHIIRGHPEMDGQKEKVLDTLDKPDCVQEGDFGTLVAVKLYQDTPLGTKHMVVIYKEVSGIDGFVLTAYFTRRPSDTRRVVWKP